jgi:hypothetical protein
MNSVTPVNCRCVYKKNDDKSMPQLLLAEMKKLSKKINGCPIINFDH